MKKITPILKNFCRQSHTSNLKQAGYPNEWKGFDVKVSFGMGQPARIPWIAFLSSEMKVTRGIYPVYLYYKSDNILILAYGVSETEEPKKSWPADVRDSAERIEDYLNIDIPRYGDSYVFKAYEVNIKKNKVTFSRLNNKEILEEGELSEDLEKILDYYEEVVSKASPEPGLFYMEKELENFLIENWKHTELGEEYDLITEEGALVSQQFPTDIGRIDILAKERETGDYVVIELKKDQTSDDTIGQLARYMGWIRKNKAKKENVKGIIIAGSYNKKLDYALEALGDLDIDVYIYQVDFELREFK